MVVGNDVTTDHISPASAIPAQSLVADYLVQRGENRDDLNVFASRRGNWQVMMRAAFHNRTLVNQLKADVPVAHTVYVPSGETLPIWEAAQRYRDNGLSVVVVAGERYGTGSSRDWAAKGLRLLGARAVLALSFERIHRSNLIGMGILPLQIASNEGFSWLNVQLGDRIMVQATPGTLRPRCKVPVEIYRVNGDIDTIEAKAAVETQLEIDLLNAGGVIPLILQNTIRMRTKDAKQ